MSEPAGIRSAEIPPGVGSSGAIAREDWIVSLGICVPPISVAYSHIAIAQFAPPRLVARLLCIDGSESGSAASPPRSDSRCNAAIPPRGATREPGGGASASLCASFLEPNAGDFFPCRHFRVFPVCSACGRKPYRQGSPNTGRSGGMGPLPGCAAWIRPQGSTRPGRRAAGRAFPIAARSHAGDAPARFPRSPRLHAPLP